MASAGPVDGCPYSLFFCQLVSNTIPFSVPPASLSVVQCYVQQVSLGTNSNHIRTSSSSDNI